MLCVPPPIRQAEPLSYQVPMITTPIAILLSSWPGLTRPSTHRRWCADGRVKPGHDDNGWSRWVILRGIWYHTVLRLKIAAVRISFTVGSLSRRRLSSARGTCG